MPEVPTDPPEERTLHPAGASRWLRPDGWIYFAGSKFRDTGDGTFQFQSKSRPDHLYHIDIRTSPYCDCWVSLRRSAALCPHLQVVRMFLKRLKAEQPHTDQ